MARALPRLLAITDLSLAPREALLERFAALARLALPGTLGLLLREHSASARERLTLGQDLARLARETEQQLWVADRLDLALLLAADGAHLGEASVSARAARSLLGDAVAISRAWHSAQLPEAPELGSLDALVLSPIVQERKGRPALGVPMLREFARRLRAQHASVGVYGLGGIAAETAGSCLDAGAAGVAVIGAALHEPPRPLLAALGIARPA
jgi:thiamine-phosphate diphosphorylase